MFEKERLERDVLNRIRWDRSLNPEEFTVCYLDRFSSRLKEVRYVDLVLDGDFITISQGYCDL